jgi:hypothetical protein
LEGCWRDAGGTSHLLSQLHRKTNRGIFHDVHTEKMKKLSVADKKQEVKTMKKRNFYNKLFAKYPDVVNLKQLREMLGGIGEGTALKLMQENRVEHFKLRNIYYIPKDSVIDYLLGYHYRRYKKLLKF